MTNPGEGSDPEFHPDAGRSRTGEREWRRMFVVSEGNEGECRARARLRKTGATSATLTWLVIAFNYCSLVRVREESLVRQ